MAGLAYSFAQPEGYTGQANIGQRFTRSYDAIRQPLDEANASQSLSALGNSLEQPAAGGGKPSLSEYGLPAREVLLPMLQNPQTRDQALGLIRDATSKRDDALDPVKQLQIKKLQYDVAHQGDGPVDTTARDAATRFKLGMQQGLTGDALRAFTLTGKLPGAAGGTDETWGLTPQAYQVPDGKGGTTVKIGVMSNQGNFKQVALPDGATPAFPVSQLNTGTGFTETNKFGGTTGLVTPIDNEGKARDTAIGSAEGANAVAAPGAIATADQMIGHIDSILNDKDLGQAVGIGGLLPAIPNTHQAAIVSSIDQLGGGAFLAAYNQLKGAGQISEVEGKKATDAIARLNRVQNIDDFKTALNDLKSVVSAAKVRAQKQAGSGAAAGSGAPPAATQTIDGVTYTQDANGDWYAE